jgi:hypothetical protein
MSTRKVDVFQQAAQPLSTLSPVANSFLDDKRPLLG